MKIKIIISGLLMFALAGPAFAQSTISGTLTGGASSGGTLSGTVGSGSGTLTGTVTAPPASGSGSGGGGGGGGGGGNSNVIDICPNIDGVQATLTGYLLQNGNCIVDPGGGTTAGGTTGGTGGGGTVLGTSTEVPNVPNTGAGGNAPLALLMLTASALTALGSVRYLLKQRT